jgi:hypothetical protein
VTADYSLREDEAMVLAEACQEVDLIDKLAAKFKGAQMVLKGAYGQPVANPLIAELRQHRTTLASLLRQLKLPDAPGTRREPLDTTARARKAANARWGNHD